MNPIHMYAYRHVCIIKMNSVYMYIRERDIYVYTHIYIYMLHIGMHSRICVYIYHILPY